MKNGEEKMSFLVCRGKDMTSEEELVGSEEKELGSMCE